VAFDECSTAEKAIIKTCVSQVEGVQVGEVSNLHYT
jgi:hypothetical protein